MKSLTTTSTTTKDVEMIRPKYGAEQYVVICFDRFGTQVSTTKATNYLEGIDIGENTHPSDGSFVVIRVLFNSTEGRRKKWESR